MIRFILFLILINTSFIRISNAQDTTQLGNGAIITFEEPMKDMGEIYYGDSLKFTFKFKNTGDKDLIIENVITTCSCTSRNYTEGIIKPGESGVIDVSFDSSKQEKIGRQNKVITIISNAKNNPERVILNFNILEK